MSETYHTGTGQKVTTHYAKEDTSYYEGTGKGDTRKEGESRVEQNRRLREESRAMVSSRPDSRESVEKESKRKKAAHEKIESDIESVRGRQYIEEEREAERKRKSESKKQKPREPIANRIGSRIPAALGGGAPPTWLSGGSGKPPAWMGIGAGTRLPAWAMDGMPNPAMQSVRGRKRGAAPRNNGLPEWFRY